MNERFILWDLPSRTDRLNTHRMLSVIRPDAPITARVVATMRNFDDLRSTLARRHREPSVDRFIDEAYMAAFERLRKDSGGPKLTDQQMLELRREGFGLDVETDLHEVWRQSIAMFHAHARVPYAVRLLVGGLYGQSVELLHAVATLLASDEPFRRRRKFPVDQHIDLKQRVVRQWVSANGVALQGEVDAVERVIGREIDHQLSREPVESFAKLGESMLAKAVELAAGAGRPNDRRFTYYLFRCLQRIGAYAVHGRVQWRSEWLRGTKANARAINGASKLQAELGAALQRHVFMFEAAHSGSKGTATTYRLRFPIELGELTHREVASALGLTLDGKNIPRR